jgi:serine/threonine protein phosphatase PrpC
MGTTATIGFIHLEQAKRVLYISNIGDSRAIVCEDNAHQVVTEDHRPSSKAEAERIT